MRAVGDQLVAIGEAEAAKRFARFGEDGELAVDPPTADGATGGTPVDEPTVALGAE
jgi:hypothetical protein